jgi:PadR family transcriptional regulator PadR
MPVDDYNVGLPEGYSVWFRRLEIGMGEFEQLILLAILRLKDQAYGVEIRRAVADRTGRDVASGAVYTTLRRLEDRGYVQSRIGETAPERTGQRRKYYRVEPAGAAALHRSYSALRAMAAGVVSELERLAMEADGA